MPLFQTPTSSVTGATGEQLPELTPEQWQQFITSDPTLKQLVAGGTGPFGMLRPEIGFQIEQYLQAKGVQLPRQMHISNQGELAPNKSNAGVALGAAASLAAPFAIGALSGLGGGGAAAPAAQTGVGVGETASTMGAIPASSVAALPGAAAAPGASGGLLSTIGSNLKSTGPNPIGAIGKGISGATSAAGNVRRADTDTNVQAQAQYANELNQRAKLEDEQRKSALADIYRQSYFSGGTTSPYVTQQRNISPAFMSALGNVQRQGSDRLAQAPQYGTNQMPALKPYETKKGILETIGGWVGPVASILGSIF